eukprot:8550412-Lingulodinium_polyedra.AAC.1
MVERYRLALHQRMAGAIRVAIVSDASRLGKRGRLVSPIVDLMPGVVGWLPPQVPARIWAKKVLPFNRCRVHAACRAHIGIEMIWHG